MRALIVIAVGLIGFLCIAMVASSDPSVNPVGLPITGAFANTPRPSGNGLVDLIQQGVDAQNTASAANQLARYNAGILTATAQESGRQTASAADLRNRQVQEIARATDDAFVVMVAQWTASAGDVINTTTAQAQGTGTAVAMVAQAETQTVAQAIATSTAVKQSTLDAFDAAQLELTLDRQRKTNSWQAVRPYLVSAVILITLIATVWRLTPVLIERMRDRYPDKAGNYPIQNDAKGTAYNPMRNPYPIAQVNREDPRIPQLTPPEMQEKTTMRDQVVQALRAPAGTARPPGAVLRQMTQQPPAQPRLPQPQFRVFRQNETPTYFTDPKNQGHAEVLEGEWRKEEIK